MGVVTADAGGALGLPATLAGALARVAQTSFIGPHHGSATPVREERFLLARALLAAGRIFRARTCMRGDDGHGHSAWTRLPFWWSGAAALDVAAAHSNSRIGEIAIGIVAINAALALISAKSLNPIALGIAAHSTLVGFDHGLAGTIGEIGLLLANTVLTAAGVFGGLTGSHVDCRHAEGSRKTRSRTCSRDFFGTASFDIAAACAGARRGKELVSKLSLYTALTLAAHSTLLSRTLPPVREPSLMGLGHGAADSIGHVGLPHRNTLFAGVLVRRVAAVRSVGDRHRDRWACHD